jgi:hypothetical protein
VGGCRGCRGVIAAQLEVADDEAGVMATLHGLKLQSGAPTSPYVLMLVFSKALKYALHKPTPTSICLTVLECADTPGSSNKKQKKKQQQLLLLLLRVCVVGGCLLCQIECRE